MNKNLSEQRKKEIYEMMDTTLENPDFEEPQIGELSNYTKLPFSRLNAYGVALNSLTTAAITALNGNGKSGIYYVNTFGKTMFQMKDTKNFIGSLKDIGGLVGGGQAQLSQIMFDPTMLFAAFSLASIDKKLDTIQELQQEMLNFLVQKEKSELKGSLNFLFDVFNNYKYNWDNPMYKNSNHIKVLDIRQEAEKKIIFYREQIISKANKKMFLHSEKAAEKQLKTLIDQFKDYQLALYLLGFSSFLEVMLLENFDKEYLSGISKKLETCSFKYRELYTKCYSALEDYLSTSIQASLLKGVAKTTAGFGKIVEKIPVISNSQIDETLIAAGDKLSGYNDRKLKKQMNSLIERQSNFVRPFIENINTVNDLYNKPIKLLIDKENFYFSAQS